MRCPSSIAAGKAPPGRGDDIDQSGGVRTVGVDRLSGQDQLAGEVDRQGSRTTKQPGAGGHRPSTDFGKSEAGGARGNNQVTRQHQLESPAQRRSFHCGDQRLAPSAAAEPVLLAAIGRVITAGCQVAARREHRVRTGERPRPQAGSSSSRFNARSRQFASSRSMALRLFSRRMRMTSKEFDCSTSTRYVSSGGIVHYRSFKTILPTADRDSRAASACPASARSTTVGGGTTSCPAESRPDSSCHCRCG